MSKIRKIAIVGFHFCCKTGKRNRLVWEEYAKMFPNDEIHLITGTKYLWDNWKEKLPTNPQKNLFIHQIPILFSRFGQFKYAFPTLPFTLTNINPDIMYASEEPIQPFVTWKCAMFAKMKKIPFFLFTYENQEKTWPWPISWMERFSVNEAGKNVCASQVAANLLKKRVRINDQQIEVFPETGIDTKIFKKSKPWSRRKPMILFTGRFLPEKGIKEMIEAKKMLEKEGHSLEWIFVGSGPMQDYMRQHGGKNLKIVNWIKPEELPRYYNDAKIFLYPSLQTSHWEEQFGYGMVEALACGTPVISTPNSGAKEILPEPWMFVPFGDAKALAKKIQEVIKSKQEYDFTKWVESRFSSKAIAKKWHTVFAGSKK